MAASELQQQVYNQLAKGSAWAILLRWSVRGIGIFSVAILARLLTPADFGVVAMATLVMGLLIRFSELGTGMVLIREREITREDCDTAWTIQAAQGLLVAIGLVLLAPLAADFFHEPRLVWVMFALAAAPLIEGLENVGMVLVRRELDFAKDFRIGVYTRVAGLVGTVAAAFALRSYWALVIGTILARLAQVVISYRMHPYRPRLSFARARPYLRFAATAMPMSVATYLSDRLPIVVGGRIADTSNLGRLHVAGEVSTMATEEVVMPITRALYPGFAKLLHDPQGLRDAFLHVLGVTTTLALPIGVGLSVVAHDFTILLLGWSWLSAVFLFQILTLRGAVKTISRTLTGNILIVAGHERLYNIAVWLELLITLPAVGLGGLWYGIDGIAVGALVASLLTLPLMAYLPVRALQVTAASIVVAVARPVVACATMAAVVWATDELWPAVPLVRLPGEIVVGALTYVATLYAFWQLFGKPPGIESVAEGYVRKHVARAPHRPVESAARGDAALPLSVLFIENAPSVSGSTISLSNLVANLPANVRPMVIFSREEQAEYFRSNFATAAEVAVVRARPQLKTTPWGAALSRAAARVHVAVEQTTQRLLAVGDLLVVYPHYAWKMSRYVKGRRVDLVVQNNGFDLGAILLSIAIRRPLVVYQRGEEADSPLVRRLSRLVAFFIANSGQTKGMLEGLGIPASRITVISPPLDLSRYSPRVDSARTRGELGITPSDRCFGILGTLMNWKGQHVFVEAAAQVLAAIPEAKALIIGTSPDPSDTSYERFLQELVARYGIGDRVIFTGFRSDVPQVMGLLDVVVHASVLPEPFGRVIVEAMAMGKPVIASAAGGPLEILEDGVDGFLVEPGNPEALAGRLCQLLADRALCARLGANGAAKAERRYDARTHGAAVSRVLGAVMLRRTDPMQTSAG